MQDDSQVKLLLAKRSLEAWNDAHAPEGVLSERSRIDALFDAGYFVLLALAPRDARQLLEHHPHVPSLNRLTTSVRDMRVVARHLEQQRKRLRRLHVVIHNQDFCHRYLHRRDKQHSSCPDSVLGTVAQQDDSNAAGSWQSSAPLAD